MKLITDEGKEIKIEDIKIVNVNNNSHLFIKIDYDQFSSNELVGFIKLLENFNLLTGLNMRIVNTDVEIYKGEKII